MVRLEIPRSFLVSFSDVCIFVSCRKCGSLILSVLRELPFHSIRSVFSSLLFDSPYCPHCGSYHNSFSLFCDYGQSE